MIRRASAAGRWVALGVAALVLTGCVAGAAVPLRQDLWRLSQRGSGVEGAAFVTQETLREAAMLTIRNNFTHFTVAPDDGRPITVLGVVGAQPRTIFFANPVGTRSGEPEVTVSVLVQMFRERDPKPGGVYDARTVLGLAIP